MTDLASSWDLFTLVTPATLLIDISASVTMVMVACEIGFSKCSGVGDNMLMNLVFPKSTVR